MKRLGTGKWLLKPCSPFCNRMQPFGQWWQALWSLGVPSVTFFLPASPPPPPPTRQVEGCRTASLAQLLSLQGVSWPQLSQVGLLPQEFGMAWRRLSSASALPEREVQESWHSWLGLAHLSGATGMSRSPSTANLCKPRQARGEKQNATLHCPQRIQQDKVWAHSPVLGPTLLSPLGNPPVVSEQLLYQPSKTLFV